MTDAEGCQQNAQEFWKNREWKRYTDGDYIYALTDSRRAHCLNQWIQENIGMMNLSECEHHLAALWKALNEIIIEEMDTKKDSEWLKKVLEVKAIVNESLISLLEQWTTLVHQLCGEPKRRNDYIFTNENVTLAYWRLSVERKNKMIFFPGIQIEVPPFLQALRVEISRFTFNQHVTSVLADIRPGDVYMKTLNDAEETHQESIELPEITENDKPKATKKEKTQPSSKLLVQNIDELVKKSKKKTTKKKTKPTEEPIVQSGLVVTPPGVKTISNSRSISTKREEKIKQKLLRNVSPIWTKESNSHMKRSNQAEGNGHLVDFSQDSFLGQTYHLVAFKTGMKTKQCGSWEMHTATQLTEYHMKAESINVSLKVPVEDNFLGQSEPTIAFSESYSDEWKKGVYTMHAQFDQTIFAVNTRLSKFGRLSLFQQSDSHFPYRRWNIHFGEEQIEYKLHTGSVEIKFILKGLLIHLETQTGDELSKLRTLHLQPYSLPEMTIRLQRQGVFIFPQEEAMRKHRNTRKSTNLEEYCYRLICLQQIHCSSCRLNASVPSDSVIITCGETNLQANESLKGTVNTSYSPSEPVISQIHKNKDTVSALFRFLMLTRPLSMTK